MMMEFIYTDPNGIEQGPLLNCSLDLEIGIYDKAKNDFEITVSTDSWDRKLTYDSRFYCVGTEFGGIVKSIEIDTEAEEVKIGGICPRKLLANDIIQPRKRTDEYYEFIGEANECIREYINSSTDFFNYIENKSKSVSLKKKLADFFVVSQEDSGITINYQARYYNTLQAFETMLNDANAKLRLIWNKNGQIELSVEPIINYSESLQFDNDYNLQIIAKKDINQCNHCIGLGKGDLQERQVVHVFKINDQYLELSEIDDDSMIPSELNTMTYDYSNVESIQELIDGTKTKVKEAQTDNSLEITFDNLSPEIGDIVGAKEYITGIFMQKPIVQKIVKCTFEKDYTDCDVDYKVGD